MCSVGALEPLDVQHEAVRESVDPQRLCGTVPGIAGRAEVWLIQLLLIRERPEAVLQPVNRLFVRPVCLPCKPPDLSVPP